MNGLYIGNFFDSTGWARAACDYALALDSSGINLACRKVQYNPTPGEVPNRLKELIDNQYEKYDFVIQQVLPPQMECDSKLGLNIGLFFTESHSYEYSDWPEYCNLMDLLFVPNSQAKEAAIKSGVKKPIEVIPCATDINKFQKNYKPLPLIKNISDSFIFYTISEFNERKNFAALVKAFHLEFETWEKVELVIKTSAHGTNITEHVFDTFLTEIKKDLRIYPRIEDYKQEHILLGHYTEEDILRLHTSGTCFVMPSHGEGWSIPTFDACGMGKPIIANGYLGSLPYLTDDNAWFIGYRMEPVTGMRIACPSTNTGKETWASIDILELRRAMREAFSNRELCVKKGNNGYRIAQQFSHLTVGQLMKTAIERYLHDC